MAGNFLVQTPAGRERFLIKFWLGQLIQTTNNFPLFRPADTLAVRPEENPQKNKTLPDFGIGIFLVIQL